MINAILDTSGSMCEKKSALFYVANTIRQYCDLLGVDVNFYNLQGKLIKSLLDIKFSNSGSVLNKLDNAIFITDGFQKMQNLEFDGIVLVGADSSDKLIDKQSKIIDKSENIIKVIDYIIQSKSISINSSQRDEEDEW